MENNTQTANPSKDATGEDIVSKVSKYEVKPDDLNKQADSKPTDKFSELEKSVNTAFISPEELANIKDPWAKRFIEDKQKQMLSGMNKKFQEIAELRKSLEEQQQQLSTNAPKYDISTKEGLRQALNDPEFSNLVKEVAQEAAPNEFLQQGGTQEEWSVLTDSEKVQFKQMREEINQLKQNQNSQQLAQMDSRLKDKYSDYDATAINSLVSDINSGKIGTEQLREMMFKALNYNNAIKRAAEITRNEMNGNISTKMDASTFNSVSNPNASQDGIVTKEEGEKSANYFSRLAKDRLKNLNNNT